MRTRWGRAGVVLALSVGVAGCTTFSPVPETGIGVHDAPSARTPEAPPAWSWPGREDVEDDGGREGVDPGERGR